MRNLLFAGLALLALSLPAYAAECQWTLDGTTPSLTEPYAVVSEPDKVAELVAALTAAGEVVPEGVTRVLLATLEGTVFYGLEVGGCLLAPVRMPGTEPARLSGRVGARVYA